MEKKAVFIVTYVKGTPQIPELPEGMEVLGVSAMAHITNDGCISTRLRADEAVIEELKNHGEVLTFVEYIEEEEI